MSSRKRYPGYAPFSRLDSAESCAVVTNTSTKKTLRMRVGAYVCLHSRSLGKCHLPCRIVKVFGNQLSALLFKGCFENLLFGHRADAADGQ